MFPTLGWPEISVRLLLAVASGALIGANRSEHGRPVGLRTVLLVCVAAAVSMIQANLLLVTVGKTDDSFVTMDLMRLPLGILTGMGFIGGGAILRRDDLVIGVTTAATLWLVTVIGLAFGGGQLGLGIAATALGMFVLSGLKWAESLMRQNRYAMLTISVDENGPTDDEISANVSAQGFQVAAWSVVHRCRRKGGHRIVRCQVAWRSRQPASKPPPFVSMLAQRPGVRLVRWKA